LIKMCGCLVGMMLETNIALIYLLKIKETSFCDF